MTEVITEHLAKQFGNVPAVEDMNLHIRDGEFVAFLGPSGCGKTTTLLMLAGIYKPSAGVIRFGSRVVNQLEPRERNIGMVFQSYALYPHMTVFENIAYPLKLKGVPKAQQRERVTRAAQTMGIDALLERRPGQLSGGQQQRVALGRALVKEPEILLFDEPLSNLDARLRLTMRGEIKQLQKRLGITSVFVTHDQTEALTMADRIAVMSQGRLQAFDTPDDLYNRPKTLFIANFVGNPPINIMDMQTGVEDGHLVARREGLALTLPPERGDAALSVAAASANGSGALKLGVRPEDILVRRVDTEADATLNAGSDTIPNTARGEVMLVEPLGRDAMLDVQVHDLRLYALAAPDQRLIPGDMVELRFNTANVQLFDPETERSLLWQ